MKEPIGRVMYGQGSIIATLNGVDDWSVTVDGKPDRTLSASIRATYLDEYRGPSQGHYGQLILNDLARRTGGTMAIRDFPPAGPDEVP